MNKSVLTHIVIIAAAVICGSYFAGDLKERAIKLMPSQKDVSSAPIGGFQKFASDVKWMLFINYLGSLKTIDKDNQGEVTKKLEEIISYDPNFEKAIQVGVMSLSVEAPDKAVEILKKASDNEQLKEFWKLPFYAGFILTHHVKDKDARLPEAINFFETAIKRSSPPENYVVNAYLRAKARQMLLESKGAIKDDNVAMLNVLFNEWKKTNRSMEMEGSSIVPNLTQRLLTAAQKVKETAPDSALVDEVRKEVLANSHLCSKCLTQYASGDKFCSNCGNNVAVFGTCEKCGAVVKGKFCQNCGTPAKQQPPAPAPVMRGPVPPVPPAPAPAKAAAAPAVKK
jgi:hypothetical protein